MTRERHDQPELIPYASHAAHGTGRTPIGIILFASGHLLMGASTLFAIARFVARVSLESAWMQLFAIAVVVAALSMIGGGAMLLMKRRGAWILSLTSFTWLAMCEAVVAALGTGWFVRPLRSPRAAALDFNGLVLTVIAAALFGLCLIVLGYLGSAKARSTFALPAGETPVGVRRLPLLAITFFLIAILFGATIGLA